MGNTASQPVESSTTAVVEGGSRVETEAVKNEVQSLTEGVKELKVETKIEIVEEAVEVVEEKDEKMVENETLSLAAGINKLEVEAKAETTEEAVEATEQKDEQMVENVEEDSDSSAETVEGNNDEISADENTETTEEETTDDKTILLLGGENSHEGLFDRMFMLNDDRSKWIEQSTRLPHAMSGGGAVFLDGTVYVVGGDYEYAVLHKWNKEDKSWKRLADMNKGRGDISSSCLAWEGSLWVFGGYHDREILQSVERYDPKEDKWVLEPDMLSPRRQAAAAIFENKIIVCGGLTNFAVCLNSVEIFDPKSCVWTSWEELPSPIRGHSVINYNPEGLAVLGGHDGKNCVRSCLIWMEKKWYSMPSMNHPCRLFAVAKLDAKIYAIGGWNRSGKQELDRVEIFDGDGWQTGPDLLFGCSQLCSVVIPKNLFD